MECLSVHLFGGFRVQRGHPPQPLHFTRTAQHLLAYLLLHRRLPHPRDILAGILWGETDDEKARACLNTALWRLRKVLEPYPMSRGSVLVTTAGGDVGINPQAHLKVDVAMFEEKVGRIGRWAGHPPSPCEAAEVERALVLYTGELLAGFYEDWIVAERERLHCLHIDALSALMHAHRHFGNLTQSLDLGLRILKEEPFREDVHLFVMQLYQDAGQRFMALRHYEKCRKKLEDELGIAPSEKTRRFYESIAPSGRSSGKPPSSTTAPDEGSYRQALATLQKALDTLEKVHRDVLKAARMVSQLMEENRENSLDGKTTLSEGNVGEGEDG